MKMRTRAFVVLLTLSCGGAIADAHYLFDFAFYRVSNASVGHSVNMEVPPKFAQPVTMNFHNVHVLEILKFLQQIYDVKVDVPPGLIADQSTPYAVRARSVTNGIVDRVDLKNVPLGEALVALMHPLHLGYVLDGDTVRLCKLEDSKPLTAVSAYYPGPELTLFDSGLLMIGGHYIKLGEVEYPTRILDPTPDLMLLGGPSVSAYPGTQAAIDMRDTAPVEYFEKLPGNASGFVRREAGDRTGMSVALDIGNANNGYVPCTLSLDTSFVTDREPASGTALNVGKPRFLKMTRRGNLNLGLNKFSAILTQFGDDCPDVLLAFVRVIEVSPPSVEPAVVQLPTYTLHTTIVQVRGEPDWQWWMQPYERAYRIYNGAGRVLGPIMVPHLADPPKNFDWLRLGFSKVKASSPETDGALGMRKVVDPWPPLQPGKKSGIPFRADTSRPQRLAPDAAHEIFGIYKALAPELPPLTPEQIQGKAVNLTQSFALGLDGQMIPHSPMLAIGEATPTAQPDVFRVEQQILLNEARLETKTPSIRRRLEFSAEVVDGSMLAFLLPVADDEYLIVLTDFGLVKE